MSCSDDLCDRYFLLAGLRSKALTKVPGVELLVVGGPAEADLTNNDHYVKLAKFAGKCRFCWSAPMRRHGGVSFLPVSARGALSAGLFAPRRPSEGRWGLTEALSSKK